MKAENLDNKINNLSYKFQKDFYSKVYPKIKASPYEKKRLTYLTIFVLSLATYIYIVYVSYQKNLFLFSLIVGAIVVYLVYCGLSYQYKCEIKSAFYKSIVEITGLKWFQGDNLSYLNCYYPQINKSKMFPPASHISEDDLICGNYNGVDLKISDVEIIDQGNSTCHSHEEHPSTTLFRGIIVYFNSNKEIKSTTLIKPKNVCSFIGKLSNKCCYILVLFWALFGGIAFVQGLLSGVWASILIGLVFLLSFGWGFVDAVILRELRHNKDLEKIILEDVTFSKKYQAYSYNQVEGRYLLTTAFIERFLRVERAFKNNRIQCSFVDDKFIVAIPTGKDSFEISNLFTSLYNTKKIDTFFKQIASVLMLVDYFKLDNDISL